MTAKAPFKVVRTEVVIGMYVTPFKLLKRFRLNCTICGRVSFNFARKAFCDHRVVKKPNGPSGPVKKKLPRLDFDINELSFEELAEKLTKLDDNVIEQIAEVLAENPDYYWVVARMEKEARQLHLLHG